LLQPLKTRAVFSSCTRIESKETRTSDRYSRTHSLQKHKRDKFSCWKAEEIFLLRFFFSLFLLNEWAHEFFYSNEEKHSRKLELKWTLYILNERQIAHQRKEMRTGSHPLCRYQRTRYAFCSDTVRE
jgi:hypothetical protein